MAEVEDPLRKLKRRHRRDLRYARADGVLQGGLAMLRPGDVAVDCGANRGDVTVAFRALCRPARGQRRRLSADPSEPRLDLISGT